MATVRPHEARARGYSVAEWPLYCEGYYHALQMALKVMELAAARFYTRRQARRLERKAAREKAGAA